MTDSISGPNFTTIITPESLPGFRLVSSEVTYTVNPSRLGYVLERWVKDPTPSSNGSIFLGVAFYPCFSQSAALAAVRKMYGANTQPDEFSDCLDVPTRGSYSGQPVGDYCWSYTREVHSNSSCMVVVKGNDLFKITLGNNKGEGSIDTSMTEAFARTIVNRLNVWPRPSPPPALNFDVQVVSKHVKPQRNQRVELKVASNLSPVSYRFVVERQGEVFYEAELEGGNRPDTFCWNGLDENGRPASNGEHSVVITARDAYGRTMTRVVQVQVIRGRR